MMISTPAAHASEITYQEWVMGILRFVEWPNEAALQPFTICQRVHDNALILHRNETLAGRKIQLVQITSPRETGPCQVFLAGDLAHQEAPAWIAAVAGRQILTIGVGRRFCDQGGAVCFVGTPLSQPRPLLNPAAFRNAGLRVHTPLHLSSSRASRS